MDRMIVGGEDHRSELPVSPKKRFDALEKYLAGLLGGRSYQIARKWIGAVLEAVGGLPLMGAYEPHQFVAMAFSGKWHDVRHGFSTHIPGSDALIRIFDNPRQP